MIDGKPFATVIELDTAVKFLMAMDDIESANEIENVMRGQSSLDEGEEKN